MTEHQREQNIKALQLLEKVYRGIYKASKVADYTFGCPLCEVFWQPNDCEGCVWFEMDPKPTRNATWITKDNEARSCIKWQCRQTKVFNFKLLKCHEKRTGRFLKARMEHLKTQYEYLDSLKGE